MSGPDLIVPAAMFLVSFVPKREKGGKTVDGVIVFLENSRVDLWTEKGEGFV